MKTKDPFNLDPLVSKRKELDERLAKEHPDIKALQDVDAAISDIIDAQETEKEQKSDIYEVKVREVKEYVKQINKSELPLYFHWGGGIRTWLYKVYEVNNELKADKIVWSKDDKHIEYTSVPPELAFAQDNVAVENNFWNEAIQLLYNKVNNE
tara:strand:- start:180 stop:638 length:459 start_codon:yes stop_codon:yes gene_type:complete